MLDSFLLELAVKQKYPHLWLQDYTESLVTGVEWDKEIKCIWVTKEEIKLFLFSGDTIFYRENPRASIVKWLELIKEFSRLTEY